MGKKYMSETIAKVIFTILAVVAIVAVCSITIYMVKLGAPALFEVGVPDLLFGTEWKPTADSPAFGILYVILTSLFGTVMSLVIGVPVGVLTAVFLAEVGTKKLVNIVQPAVELLAAVPSVIYGLLGIMLLKTSSVFPIGKVGVYRYPYKSGQTSHTSCDTSEVWNRK